MQHENKLSDSKPPTSEPAIHVANHLTMTPNTAAATDLFQRILRSVQSANDRHRKEHKADDAA